MKCSISFFLLAGIYLTALTGCGSGEGTGSSVVTRSGDDTLLSPADSMIYVSDTILLDLMADYGIASIDDIDASGSDRIALLDGVSAAVTVITDSGELIARAGGSGSGPGEFQWPSSISISSSGSVAVSDQMAGTVRILEPDLDSYVDLHGFMMANPGIIHLNPDGSFTGMRMVFRAEDGNTVIGYQTALWLENVSETEVVYKEDRSR